MYKNVPSNTFYSRENWKLSIREEFQIFIIQLYSVILYNTRMRYIYIYKCGKMVIIRQNVIVELLFIIILIKKQNKPVCVNV